MQIIGIDLRPQIILIMHVLLQGLLKTLGQSYDSSIAR